MSHFRTDSGLSGWQEVIRGYDVFHPGIVDDSLGVALPLCVLASPFALRRGRRHLDLFVIGAVQLAAFVAFAPTSRLMLTALVPLALLGAAALVRAWRSAGGVARSIAAAAGAVVLAGQLVLVAWILVVSYDALPYVVGAETEAQYVARTRDYARPYAALAQKAPPDGAGSVLLLGENRSYHLDRPALSAGNLDGPRMAAWLARFPTPESLADELRRRGVTHVVMHRPWYRVAGSAAAPANMLEKEYVLEVSPETDAVLSALFARSPKIYEDGKYEVYQIH
jgi:hypothetical protein